MVHDKRLAIILPILIAVTVISHAPVAAAMAVGLAGKTIVVKDGPDPGDESKRKIKWISKDAAVIAPARGGSADPRCIADGGSGSGGQLRFRSDRSAASTEDTFRIALPCENWKALGSDANPKGYKYLDRELDDGPCKVVIIKDQQLLKALCSAKVSPLGFDLTVGTDQGRIQASLFLGDEELEHCAEFEPFGDKNGGDGKLFRGKDADPPSACPAICVPLFTKPFSNLPSSFNSGGVLWMDIDNDGDQDLFLRETGLYVNDGSGQFVDETLARGVSVPSDSVTRPVSAADFDGDGSIDFFVGYDTRSGTTHNQLYRNDGSGSFTDVAAAAGLQLASNTPRSAPFVDHDADNDIDLLYSNEFNPPGMFRNDGSLPFVNESTTVFSPTNIQGDASAYADFDDDGDLDLYIATGSTGALNRLFVSNNDTNWTDMASTYGVQGPNPSSERWSAATWVDLDHDGDLDLHVISSSTDLVYLSAAGVSFAEVTAASIGLGESNFTGTAMWVDYDLDGDIDAYIVGSGLYANDGGGQFSLVGTAPVAGNGAAWADADGDGLWDVLISGGSNSGLHRTSLPAGCIPNNSFRVRAVTDGDGDARDGDTSDDRDAIGARITIDLDDDGDFATNGHIHLVGSAQNGQRSQNQLAPIVGMGQATEAVVRVRFRDGTEVTTVANPGDDLVIRDQ